MWPLVQNWTSHDAHGAAANPAAVGRHGLPIAKGRAEVKTMLAVCAIEMLLLLIQDFGRVLGIIAAKRGHCPPEAIGANDLHQLGAALGFVKPPSHD